MNKNILLLLSNDFDNNLELNEICKIRANYAYSFYNEGDIIFTLGWKGKFSKESISSEMKKYLIKNYELPNNLIISISESKDTVGDAFFSRLYINKLGLVHRKLKVVTSDWHLPRVEFIFNTIFPNVEIEYYGIHTPGGDIIKEKQSLEIYKETFKGVDFNNFDEIRQRLYTKHKLYYNYNNQ